MFKVKLMNKIAKIGLNQFDPNNYELSENYDEYDAIMVRSAQLHDTVFPNTLKVIARCGAGVNNIPIDKCSDNGIVVFNTPGANANGVKELAICSLLLASRDIFNGIEWVKTLEVNNEIAKVVEKGKSAFVGNEILGKTLGVLGLGAIGRLVANAAVNLGMKVIGYDPYLSETAKSELNPFVKCVNSYDDVYKDSDYITVHVPSTPDTKNMINKNSLSLMKDGVKIINLSRADLVCASDIKDAIVKNKVAKYVTDFPIEETVNVSNIINIPHLGASTIESEDNCAIMAAKQVQDFLDNGNIKNSVNYPNVSLPRSNNNRISILYNNDINIINEVTSLLKQNKLSILNIVSGSKQNNGYAIIETNEKINENIIKEIATINSIKKVYCY